MDGVIRFVLGLFFGAMGGFFMCALAIAASRSNESSDEEQAEWVRNLKKQQEDINDDRK